MIKALISYLKKFKRLLVNGKNNYVVLNLLKHIIKENDISKMNIFKIITGNADDIF